MRIRQLMVISLACIGIAIGAPAAVARADGPRLDILSPTTQSVSKDTMQLKMQLKNANPTEYVYFWAVDNGQWNRIQPYTLDASQAMTTISVADWSWKKNNMYTLQFIALNFTNNTKLEQELDISIGRSSPSIPRPETPVPKLFADSEGEVARSAKSWAKTHPNVADNMNYLASQSMTPWFGGWNSDVQKDVALYMDRATKANAVPAFVVYNIPYRDCGSYSAGGAATSAKYLEWIRQVAAGVGSRSAMIIVEPDAIASMDCLGKATQSERLSLMRQAVDILKTDQTKVYIDAGHPKWKSVDAMAKRLKAAGIEQADGFSLNVSNFISTKDNQVYGTQLSKQVDGKHFVVDTGRNGNGASKDNEWCNPSGRALGDVPTLQTGNNLIDAYLWVKGPGGSDGTCGAMRAGTAAPSAGSWWPQYAEELLHNAGK